MPVAIFSNSTSSSNYWASYTSNMAPAAKSTPAPSAAPSTDKSADTSTDKPLITTGAKGKSFFENVLDIVNPLEHLPIVSTIYHALTGNESGDLEKMAGDTIYGGPIGLASSVADLAFEKITGKSFGDTILSLVGLDGDDKASDGNTVMASNAAKTPDATSAISNPTSLAPAAINAQISTPFLTSISPILPSAFATSAQLTEVPSVAVAPAAPATPAKATPVTAMTAQNAVDISPQTDALLQALQKNGITGPMQAQAMDAYRRTMSLKPAYTN